MCVWCAYSGDRPAAEILTACGERIEGLWSGFFTGLVTCDGAQLHCGKVTGWSRFWHERHDLSDFPGTCGLWHSRTNSGGDQRWAHPFLGSQGLVAMVGQGSPGVFAGSEDEHAQIAEGLLAKGVRFPSASPVLKGRKNYPALSDGTQVHVSDLVVQVIEREYVRTNDPVAAIRHAMESIREEATNVVIFKDRPGMLFYGTTSQRVVAARYEGGVALAITSLAFGQPRLRCTELPENSVGCIAPGRLSIEKLSPLFDDVDENLPENGLPAVLSVLRKNGPCSLAELCDKAIAPLMGAGFTLRATATYRCLETLVENNQVRILPQTGVNRDGGEGRADMIALA